MTTRKKQRYSNGRGQSNSSLDLHLMYDVPSDRGLKEYYVQLKYWPKKGDKDYVLKVRMRKKSDPAVEVSELENTATWGEVVLKLRVSNIMEGIIAFTDRFGLPG